MTGVSYNEDIPMTTCEGLRWEVVSLLLTRRPTDAPIEKVLVEAQQVFAFIRDLPEADPSSTSD